MAENRPPADHAEHVEADDRKILWILVGTLPAQRLISINLDIAITRSRFIRNTRNGLSAAESEQPLILPNVTPDDFELYRKCVNGKDDLRDIDSTVEGSEADGESDDTAPIQYAYDAVMTDYKANIAFEEITRAYIVADKLQDLAMANTVLDTVLDVSIHFGVKPKSGPVNFTYANTAHGNPLRAYFRDCWIHETGNAAEALRSGGFSPDFILDVATETMQIKATHNRNELGKAMSENLRKRVWRYKCHYHQHDDRHKQEKCKAPGLRLY